MNIKNKLLITLPLTALVLLGSASSASAQSILLSSGNFGLLAGTAITTTGPTGPTITNGDVGSYSITGPMVINNGVQVTTDPTLSNALGDLLTATNGLLGMPSNQNLSTIDLGGLTLLPGVYTYDSAANQALSTILTLNANGQNKAVWVFQIHSSLTFGANDQILMTNLGTNAGTDDGIFFVAATGGITFGANDIILGNFLAGTSIAFGNQDTFSGSALAQAAISSLDITDNLASNSFNGGLKYGPGGAVVPVPEPAAILWLMPLGAIGLVLVRRWSAANRIIA